MRELTIDSWGECTVVRETINGGKVIIARFYGKNIYDNGKYDADIFIEGVKDRGKILGKIFKNNRTGG